LHFQVSPKENKRIPDELGVDQTLLDRATDEKYPFLSRQTAKTIEKKV